jgi:hypothetical protein
MWMWKSVVAIAATALMATRDAAAQNVNVGRLLRFSCSQLVIERVDPVVSPGMNPSPHTHQIVGGNSFNVTQVSLSFLSLSELITLSAQNEDLVKKLTTRR